MKVNNMFKKHSPTILSVIGSVGVGITAIISARDTVKAIKIIDFEQSLHTRELDVKEKIKIAAPCYIPTVVTGLSTILCICSANKLSKDIQKSLTGAYMLLDRSYKEYRSSVKEVYGKDGDLSVIKNIAGKKVNEIELVDEEDDIFFDFTSLQFFPSKLSKIYEAEKAANEILQTHGYVSLGTVYHMMGKDSTEYDESVGWSIGAGKLYDYKHIELSVEETIGKDGAKYYIVDFMDTPTEDYMYI